MQYLRKWVNCIVPCCFGSSGARFFTFFVLIKSLKREFGGSGIDNAQVALGFGLIRGHVNHPYSPGRAGGEERGWWV